MEPELAREPGYATRGQPGILLPHEETLAEAQERYRRIEARFHLLEQATGQLTWVTDAQGLVDDMPSWRAYSGTTIGDIRGMGWLTTLHPDDRASTQAAWEVAVRDHVPYTAEYRVRRRDGVYRWFVARGMPLIDAEGVIREWVGTSTDITDRKMMERELAERAQQLDTAFATIRDAIFVYDATGAITLMNPAVTRLFGVQPGDTFFTAPFAARALLIDLRDEDDRPLPDAQTPVARLLRGEALATSVRLHTRDGRDRVMSLTGAPIRDDTGAVVGAVAVYRDITEHRAVERRTLAALNALLEMAQAVVTVPQGTESAIPHLLHASPRSLNLADLIRRVLACDRVGLLAIDPHTHIPQPLAVAGLSEAETVAWWEEQSAQQTPIDTTTPEYRTLHAGDVVFIDYMQPPYRDLPNPYGIRDVLIAPMRVGDHLIGMMTLDYRGAPHAYTPDEVRLVRALSQLTALIVEHERLLREREVAETRTRALEAANARMDGFLHMVNHELKTPLTALRAYIDVAALRARRQATPADPTQQRVLVSLRQVLDQAKEQGQRMTRLLQDLLEASAINTDRLEMRMAPCDLAHLTRSAVRQQRLLWPERVITVHASLPQGAAMVQGDELRLSQVLINFLNNALKYAPPEQPIAVRVSTTRGRVRVAISDHGPGLTEAEQARIWGRFERGDQQQNGGGLGLGLYISQAIIAAHGGEVGVESVAEHGATFWFSLPQLPWTPPTESTTAAPADTDDA